MIAIALGPSEKVRREFKELPTWDRQTFAALGKAKHGMTWRFDGEMLVRQGIVNPLKEGGRGHYPVGKNEEPAAVLERALSRWDDGYEALVEPLNIPPGRYFPRMARPHHQHPGDMPSGAHSPDEFAHVKAAAAIQASTLTRRLLRAFQIVDPDSRNLKVFGSEFRDILILASTEVEAQAKGILRANQYQLPVKRFRFNTSDFVKVEPALRLKDYALGFHQFPWIDPVWPFAGWEPSNPTGSLGWYAAYNAVKHDREKEFPQATLENAILATAAIVVICIAEFGRQFLQLNDPLGEVFALRYYPAWGPGDTQGHSVRGDAPLTPICYPFD